MIIVSDTSPLNYLILIGLEHVLPMISARLLTTPEVLEEMRAPGASEQVRAWAQNPPAWLHQQSAKMIDPSILLGKGESSAISLAVELKVSYPDLRLLIDERDGRDAAKRRGIQIAGTLSMLSEGSRLGLLDLPSAITSLQATSFHAKPALLEEVLRLDRELRDLTKQRTKPKTT